MDALVAGVMALQAVSLRPMRALIVCCVVILAVANALAGLFVSFVVFSESSGTAKGEKPLHVV
eukprot:7879497-Ditylum_brightwellii.AAC.1